MSGTASGDSNPNGSPEPGEYVRWCSALWIVTERDGDLSRIERVGTVPTFGLGALWASASLLEPVAEGS